jgi:hypothetical protein
MMAGPRSAVRKNEAPGMRGANGPALAKVTMANLFGFAGYAGESGGLGYAPKGGCQRARHVALRRLRAALQSSSVLYVCAC